MASLDFPSKGELIRTHACRAIGNICFDCNAARKAVAHAGGLEKLLAIMKQFQENEENELCGEFVERWRKTSVRGLFLDAPSHLYMRLCPSIRPSVRRSVRPQLVSNAY